MCTSLNTHRDIEHQNGASKISLMMTSGELGQLGDRSEIEQYLDTNLKLAFQGRVSGSRAQSGFLVRDQWFCSC